MWIVESSPSPHQFSTLQWTQRGYQKCLWCFAFPRAPMIKLTKTPGLLSAHKHQVLPYYDGFRGKCYAGSWTVQWILFGTIVDTILRLEGEIQDFTVSLPCETRTLISLPQSRVIRRAYSLMASDWKEKLLSRPVISLTTNQGYFNNFSDNTYLSLHRFVIWAVAIIQVIEFKI
jgi:hypothetical protein